MPSFTEFHFACKRVSHMSQSKIYRGQARLKKRPWSQDGNSSFCYTKTTIIIIEFFVTQNITVTVLEIFSSGIFRTFLKKKSSTSTDFTFKHFVENIYIERKFILPGMRTLDPLPDLGPGEFMATKIFVELVISIFGFFVERRSAQERCQGNWWRNFMLQQTLGT